MFYKTDISFGSGSDFTVNFGFEKFSSKSHLQVGTNRTSFLMCLYNFNIYLAGFLINGLEPQLLNLTSVHTCN